MNRAIARRSSPIVGSVEQACHAGGRGFESRRSRRKTSCKSGSFVASAGVNDRRFCAGLPQPISPTRSPASRPKNSCKRACSVASLGAGRATGLGHPAHIPRAHDRSASARAATAPCEGRANPERRADYSEVTEMTRPSRSRSISVTGRSKRARTFSLKVAHASSRRRAHAGRGSAHPRRVRNAVRKFTGGVEPADRRAGPSVPQPPLSLRYARQSGSQAINARFAATSRFAQFPQSHAADDASATPPSQGPRFVKWSQT
jgi:hypothetical protein